MGRFRVAVLGICTWCVVFWASPGSGEGVPADHQFSADLVTIGPQGVLGKGRLYVGESFTRTELSQGERPVVQILDQRTGRGFVVNPAQESYIEELAPSPPRLGSNLGGAAAKGPCGLAVSADCRKVGDGVVAGRPVVEWELVAHGPDGKELRMDQWIDAERGLVLRSESSSGNRTDLSLVGKDSVGGRLTEKWEVAAMRPSGEVSRSYLWYDPALDVMVREELPGGFARELTNIRVGTQPSALFSVPRGYKKLQLGGGGAVHSDSK